MLKENAIIATIKNAPAVAIQAPTANISERRRRALSGFLIGVLCIND
jgi:hypothetical protein